MLTLAQKPKITIYIRAVDVDAVRRRLSMIGRLCQYAARARDPREPLAMRKLLELEPRGNQ